MKKNQPRQPPKTKPTPQAEESHIKWEGPELEERERLAALSLDVSIALTAEKPLNASLDRCAKALFQHLNVAFARIWTLNQKEEVLELRASAGMYTHLDGFHSRIPIGKHKIGLIARERQPHLTNVVIGDPLVHDQEWATREGMVAFAGYPLIVGERVVGVMAVFSQTTISENTRQTMAQISHAVALGIAHKEKDQELEQLEHRNELILQAAGQGIYGVNIQGALIFLNPAAERMLGWKVHEILGKDKHEVLHHTQANGQPYPRKECPIYAAFKDGLVHHRDSEVFFRKDGTAFPVEFWSTPMWDQGKLVGAVITFSDITERKVTEGRLRDQQTQLCAWAAEIGKVEERERHRIARGLHDDIGQTLATLKLQLGHPKLGSPDTISTDWRRELLKLVDHAILTTRTLTFELGSPILDELGLLAALQDLGERWQAGHPEIWVQVDGPDQPVYVEGDIAIVLFRSVRELLLNIEKHTHAQHVYIRVETGKDRLRIVVEDNGIGFDPEESAREQPLVGGFGLLSITEQIKGIGGHFEIKSSKGQGTLTVLEVPMIVEKGEDQERSGNRRKHRTRTHRDS